MLTHKNYTLAALCALTSFTGWTMSDALLKLVRQENIPQGQIMIISALSGMAVIFLFCLLRGNLRRLQPHKWRGLIALGCCQWLAFVCWLAALPRLPLTNMYVVAFLTPMVVACLAALFLHEHPGWKRGTAIAVGFAGVVTAVNPLGLMQREGAWIPYAIVFASMLGTATQMLMLRAVGRKESSECMSFYPRVAIALAGIGYCATTGVVAMKAWVFLALCASGALGGIGWVLMAKAYKNAPAAAVAPFHYSQMITGALLGYFIWSDVPSPYLICGTLVIVASGVYLVRHERRASRMAPVDQV